VRKIAILLLLAIPPWVAAEWGVAKWVALLAAAPFFLFAMTLGNPEEELLGEASAPFRKRALVLLAAGGLVLGGVLYLLWQVLFARA